MKRDAVVILTDDAEVIADLVRVGCAAIAALPIRSTDAVGQMRRDRRLRIGAAFLDELQPENEETDA